MCPRQRHWIDAKPIRVPDAHVIHHIDDRHRAQFVLQEVHPARDLHHQGKDVALYLGILVRSPRESRAHRQAGMHHTHVAQHAITSAMGRSWTLASFNLRIAGLDANIWREACHLPAGPLEHRPAAVDFLRRST
jgi:hypothetical protein